MRKVLYLMRRSSIENTEAVLPCPDPADGDMDVTVILLEGAESCPIQTQCMLKLVEDAKESKERNRDVSEISYGDLLRRVFEADTVIVV